MGKKHSFWWFEPIDYEDPIPDFTKGLIVAVTIIFFPIWIWGYIAYLILIGIGKLFKQRVVEGKDEYKI